MSHKLVDGSFSLVRDERLVQYATKMGYPKDMCDKMKGTHWRMTIGRDGAAFVGHITCEEMPMMNSLESFTEGQEKAIDSPLFGGKAKVKYVSKGDNRFFTSIDSEQYGLMEMRDSYTEEGATIEMVHKNSGATLSEFWPREVKESGWFRKTRADNMVAFMKAQGFPTEGIEALRHQMNVSICGDRFKITELFGDFTNTFCCKLDEESDYLSQFGPEMSFERRVLITRLGPGRYKMLSKGKKGENEEWELKFCHKGAMWSGVDKRSGLSCAVYMEPFINICGTYKSVVLSGFQAFGEAMGMTSELATQMNNERDAILTITEKEGYYTTVYDSKFIPINVTFKMNEEYTMKYPGIPGEFKCLDTMNGNVIMNVAKGPKSTAVTECILTENYLIQTSKILGTDLTTKIIMERC